MALGLLGLAGKGLRALGSRKQQQTGQEVAQKVVGRSTPSPLPGKKNPAINFDSPIGTGVYPSASQTYVSKSNESGEGNIEEVAFQIKVKTVQVKNILKGSLAFDKMQERVNQSEQKKAKRTDAEEQLEKDAGKGKFGLVIPGSKKIKSIWERIFDFFTTVLWGWVAVRLVRNSKLIGDWLPVLGGIADWVIGLGAGLLNILTTAITLGYDAYDWTKDKVVNFFGSGNDGSKENVAKQFDNFSTRLNRVMNLVLAVGIAASLMASGIRNPFRKPGRIPNRGPINRFRRLWRKFRQPFNRKLVDRAKDIRRLNEARKRARFLRRIRPTNLRRMTQVFAGKLSPVRLLRSLKGTPLYTGLKRLMFPLRRVPYIGALLDFAVNYFIFGESLGKSAFKATGAGLGSWLLGLVGALGGPIGAAIGLVAGGWAGDALGGWIYDQVFGGATTQKFAQRTTDNTDEQSSVSTQKPSQKPSIQKLLPTLSTTFSPTFNQSNTQSKTSKSSTPPPTTGDGYGYNRALFDGVVVADPLGTNHQISGNRGYGNFMIVRSIDPGTGDEFDAIYAHFPNQSFPSPGTRVTKGQILGKMATLDDPFEQRGSITGAHTSIDFFPAGGPYTKSNPYSNWRGLVERINPGSYDESGESGTDMNAAVVQQWYKKNFTEKYHSGGEVPGSTERLATLIGGEFVIDPDSTENINPLLDYINRETSPTYASVSQALRKFAPYDAMMPETIVVTSSNTVNQENVTSDQTSRKFVPMFSGGGGGAEDPYDFLYKGNLS